MPRKKLTEYKAKQILFGDAYRGISLPSEKVPKGKSGFVVKVDQGVKKRFVRGLVKVDVGAEDIKKALSLWGKQGFFHFLVEPYFPHEKAEEKYLSFERVRGGIRMLFAKSGGIDIEAHPEAVATYLIAQPGDISKIHELTSIPEEFLSRVFDLFLREHFVFLELNPVVIRDGMLTALDAAAMVDSAGAFEATTWRDTDIVSSAATHEAEKNVAELAETTPASLKLTMMNENGGLFFLLSGGGGSMVIADEASELGAGKEIGNYGEYSGGPTREETYLYAREVLTAFLASKAKRKALVIAGGVANFTDVLATFLGIMDALQERAHELRKAGVKVFVRRGGKNEAVGLSRMEAFLKEQGIFGAVDGSEASLTSAVKKAVDFLQG